MSAPTVPMAGAAGLAGPRSLPACAAAPTRRLPDGPLAALAAVAGWLRELGFRRRRRHQRLVLVELDEWTLRDIGAPESIRMDASANRADALARRERDALGRIGW